MTRIGIIGFGFMGRTHLEAYGADGRASVVAVAEIDAGRLRGEAQGNLPAPGAGSVLPEGVRRYETPASLLADAGIDAVSVCVPTPLHPEIAVAALEHGKHALVEKPLALDGAEAARVADAARRHGDLVCLPAMCMRFWPGWSWLREVVADGRHGPVRSAVFTRLGAVPHWSGAFYRDPSRSGSAILDLHIHDADFVRFCFGDPVAVTTRAASGSSGGLDHVVATYHYDDGPTLVAAEGGWLAPGVPFTMTYRVSFERATACFDLAATPPLTVYPCDGEPVTPELPAGTGYVHEVAHFLDAIAGTAPAGVLTIDDGVEAVRLVEAERRSAETGERVAYAPLGPGSD